MARRFQISLGELLIFTLVAAAVLGLGIFIYRVELEHDEYLKKQAHTLAVVREILSQSEAKYEYEVHELDPDAEFMRTRYEEIYYVSAYLYLTKNEKLIRKVFDIEVRFMANSSVNIWILGGDRSSELAQKLKESIPKDIPVRILEGKEKEKEAVQKQDPN